MHQSESDNIIILEGGNINWGGGRGDWGVGGRGMLEISASIA